MTTLQSRNLKLLRGKAFYELVFHIQPLGFGLGNQDGQCQQNSRINKNSRAAEYYTVTTFLTVFWWLTQLLKCNLYWVGLKIVTKEECSGHTDRNYCTYALNVAYNFYYNIFSSLEDLGDYDNANLVIVPSRH